MLVALIDIFVIKLFSYKELDQLLKRRREANRLKRIHDKNHSVDSTLGTLLAESYRKRMDVVQSAIRRRETFVKMRHFHRKCTTAKNKSRGFWGFLKGDHRNRTVSEIVDPVDSTLGTLLAESYRKRKEVVQSAIRRRETFVKMRNFHRKCTTAKNKSRGFLKGDHRNRTVSEIVDPVDKNLILDEQSQIEDALQQYFSNIGNHANNMQDVDNFKDNVRKKVAKLDENLVPTTDMFSLRFSRTSIETSLKNLANGKAVGDDGIPNEFLKNGGEAMLNSLVDLFMIVSDLEIIPSEWKNGIIKPLHKSGSAMDLDNYRGITLTSNVYKVFSKILEECIMSHLEGKNILGEAQGAFRRDRRLEDHLFTLHGLCSLQKYAKKKTYIAFLDLSKAFDRVWRDGLFYLLWENGIQGKCWRLLRSIYDGVSNKVVFW